MSDISDEIFDNLVVVRAFLKKEDVFDNVLTLLSAACAATVDAFFHGDHKSLGRRIRLHKYLEEIVVPGRVTLDWINIRNYTTQKAFLAQCVMRGWVDFNEDLDSKVLLLPLFADLPAYKAFLTQAIGCSNNNTVTTSKFLFQRSWSVVDAAYVTNNLELLEWCRALKTKSYVSPFPGLWQLSPAMEDNVRVTEKTRQWWAKNAPFQDSPIM